MRLALAVAILYTTLSTSHLAAAASDGSILVGIWQVSGCVNQKVDLSMKSYRMETEFQSEQIFVDRIRWFSEANCTGQWTASESVKLYRLTSRPKIGDRLAFNIQIVGIDGAGEVTIAKDIIAVEPNGMSVLLGFAERGNEYPTKLDNSRVWRRVR